MWNCRVTSNDKAEYGAYASVFDNLVGFVIGHERSARTYLDLIEENRRMFLDITDNRDRRNYDVVEPRELLFLMNHIDTADRLYWAPRPYRRSGDMTKEYLFLCPENDTLACIFCGFKSQISTEAGFTVTKGGVARSCLFEGTSLAQVPDGLQSPVASVPAAGSTTAAPVVTADATGSSLGELQNSIIRACNRYRHDLETNLYENFGSVDVSDYIPDDGEDVPPPPPPTISVDSPTPAQPTESTTRPEDVAPRSTVEHRSRMHTKQECHFDGCPIVWLSNNCKWKTKHSVHPIHEPSKFGNALQLLERAAGRSMSTEYEWNEFVRLTSSTTTTNVVMGACKDTLIKCYRTIVQMKLDKINRYHGDICEFRRLPLYTVYYDANGENDTIPNRQPFCRPLACILECSSFPFGSTYRIDKRGTSIMHVPKVTGDFAFEVIQAEEEVNRINDARVAENRDERNKSRNFLSQILNTKRGDESETDSSTTPPPPPSNKRFAYAIDTETAWKAFVMHGFCTWYRSENRCDDIYSVNATGDFVDRDTCGYTILHKFNVPPVDVACIYCGFSFGSRLCHPKVVDHLYNEREKSSIVKYLTAPSTNVTTMHEDDYDGNDPTTTCGSWVWWNRKPGRYRHFALSPDDVISSHNAETHRRLANEPLERSTKSQPAKYRNNEKIALWLSASLNNSHGSKCIFRIKNRHWTPQLCPVCLVEEIAHHETPLFTCGHTVCNACINDLRLTVCPLCKEGTRLHRITV